MKGDGVRLNCFSPRSKKLITPAGLCLAGVFQTKDPGWVPPKSGFFLWGECAMRKMLLDFFVIGFGGAFGAMARFGIARFFTQSAFPIGTMLINLTGCMFLGWFMTIIGNHVGIFSEPVRLAIAVGFVGAYTTFSTYMYESDRMVGDGALLRATLYIVGSVTFGLLFMRMGIILGRRF